MAKILKVGLTGGLGCGKTTVAEVWRDLGAEIIDADALGHAAIAPDGPAYRAVLEAFGDDLLDTGGAIVRSRLAERVFGRPTEVARLNAIVHPAIVRLGEKRCLDYRRRVDRGILVVDAALIYEAGVAGRFDKVVVVDCPVEQQVARFAARREVSVEEAQRRLAAQLPREEKLRRADYVLDASGTVDDTCRRAAALYTTLSRLL
jgi:dephospho-CoA kinase